MLHVPNRTDAVGCFFSGSGVIHGGASEGLRPDSGLFVGLFGAVEADAAGVSVSAVIRDAVARGLPLVKDARRKQRQRDRHAAGAGEA